jgi:pyruvate/2-oxoglutarate dehydrogenase complex dihydrolipoamide acyltransferase (E2) component
VLAGVIGAAGLAAVVVATRGGSTSAATAPAAPAAAPRRGANRGERDLPVQVTELRLRLLDQTRPDIGEPDRNPFRFRARPAPPAPKPEPAAAPAPKPAAPPVARPAIPSGPPPPPPITLRFIGLFEAPGQVGRVAMMSDGRGSVFQGKEGDIIDGRYRVGRVTADSTELSYTDGRGRQTIRLTGQ